MVLPSTVSVGTPAVTVRSIRVAQMNPRPAAPATVVVKIETVTWPSMVKGVVNLGVFQPWTLHMSLGLAAAKFERQAVPCALHRQSSGVGAGRSDE